MNERRIDSPESGPWEAAPEWNGTPLSVPAATASSSDSRAGDAVRRHPIAMTLGGLLAGLGVALLLVHFARIAIGTNAPLVVIAIGGVVGLALAYTLPPRSPRSARRTR